MSPDGKARGFTRSALRDEAKIILVKAVCDYCGFVIIGSVSDGLVEQERSHAEQCSMRKPRTASDSA